MPSGTRGSRHHPLRGARLLHGRVPALSPQHPPSWRGGRSARPSRGITPCSTASVHAPVSPRSLFLRSVTRLNTDQRPFPFWACRAPRPRRVRARGRPGQQQGKASRAAKAGTETRKVRVPAARAIPPPTKGREQARGRGSTRMLIKPLPVDGRRSHPRLFYGFLHANVFVKAVAGLCKRRCRVLAPQCGESCDAMLIQNASGSEKCTTMANGQQ